MTLEHVGNADRVVIFGLSLNVLDVELGAIIAEGISSNHQVVIVDPNNLEIRRRLNLISRVEINNVSLFNPNDLA